LKRRPAFVEAHQGAREAPDSEEDPLDALKHLGWIGVIVIGLVACGGPSEKAERSGSEQNRPPAIKLATIQPTAPNAQNDLVVDVHASDPDGDALEYRYQWLVNGEERATGERLYAGRFRKGDEVECVIVPSDGQTEGEPYTTRAVKVVNSLPVVEAIGFEPETVYPGQEARVVVQTHDSDGDRVYVRCDWYVNDTCVLEDSETLPLKDVKKGDRLSVRVNASDDEAQTRRWAESAIMMVQNRPPRIASEPPANWSLDKGFRYQVKTEDPDGDKIQVRLEGDIPPGAEWDEESATLTWKPSEDAPGPYALKVIADDGDGGTCTQSFTLKLQKEQG
jgi:hypothetical protein